MTKDVFIKEFMEADAKMNEKFGKDMSLIDLEKMLRKSENYESFTGKVFL